MDDATIQRPNTLLTPEPIPLPSGLAGHLLTSGQRKTSRCPSCSHARIGTIETSNNSSLVSRIWKSPSWSRRFYRHSMAGVSTRAAAALLLLAEFGRVSLREACVLVQRASVPEVVPRIFAIYKPSSRAKFELLLPILGRFPFLYVFSSWVRVFVLPEVPNNDRKGQTDVQ
ncbi:hypothetical protein BO83DRAFT_377176 [Aspergillus eucalypticola CBS 122712]|uniref:Uncharacterized protein n=1 Tax=Aspergillus eucalypticola (strain CBS 122712 / IBT 29274) TaxID=1448314 RepID=A0A317VUK5_ASPEC|nr:uncharacterized protein BO83DRAFT_377176 [Aspergillus eucalypticola CBS 122712]PWY76707.1 hypothetical protein BO83DRAFT_377176 [Aspergillus eucalypticola CBS 122712]